MNQTLLRVDGVAKRFGDRSLLRDAHAELESGNGYVLTGGNGSGKTTFLRIVAGLERAQAGTIAFRGHQGTFARYPEKFRREPVDPVHERPFPRGRLVRVAGIGAVHHAVIPPERRHVGDMDKSLFHGAPKRRHLPRPHPPAADPAQTDRHPRTAATG